jgi:hypothetical protein
VPAGDKRRHVLRPVDLERHRPHVGGVGQPGDRALDIGTGSGYQAAVLADLVKDVVSLEILCPLADSARTFPAAVVMPADVSSTLDALACIMAFRLCGSFRDPAPIEVPHLLAAFEQAQCVFADQKAGNGGLAENVLLLVLRLMQVPVQVWLGSVRKESGPRFHGIALLADMPAHLADRVSAGGAGEFQLIGCFIDWASDADAHVIAGFFDERDAPVLFDSSEETEAFVDWRAPLASFAPGLEPAARFFQRTAIYASTKLLRRFRRPQRCSAAVNAAAAERFRVQFERTASAAPDSATMCRELDSLYEGVFDARQSRRPIDPALMPVLRSLSDPGM